jgi:hypothetical protein
MFTPHFSVGIRSMIAALLIAGPVPPARSEEESNKERLSKIRLKVMEEAVAGFEVQEKGGAAGPVFGGKPLLRYSDPTRTVPGANSLLDATVWRLGKSGRPAGLLTMEIYNDAEDRAILSYEFAALAKEELSLTHTNRAEVAWQTPGGALAMQPLADAPMPAGTSSLRVGQMRQLARRFKVSEKYMDSPTECRLLSQPIDRYESPEDGIIDGALFVYANGTNPEIGILLECSEAGWSYGFARLSAAESKVELSGKEVASFPGGDFRLARQSNYVAHNHLIKIAKD